MNLHDSGFFDGNDAETSLDGATVDDANVDAGIADPTLLPATACEIEEASYAGVGLGFPRSTDRLPSTGTVNGVVLFADFPDVEAEMTPEEAFALISPGAEDFFEAVSYGRMDLELHPNLEWLRLGNPSASYGEAIRTFEGHRAFISEAIALADDDVDFSDADIVIVISTPNASDITYGPAWTGGTFAGGTLTPDGARIRNGATSGIDLTGWGPTWLNHEMGHTMSLVDLYSFDGPTGFTRPFSLMDLISSEAPEYLAYERWFLGWIDDNQIACRAASGTTMLTPVEQATGKKAVIVPLEATRALVVESRRALGYDHALSREGAVAYIVNTTIASGHGTIQVLNGQEALQEGDSVTSDGVTVTVVSSTESGDEVQVDLVQADVMN